MSGGDNTSARAVDVRIAGQLAEILDALAHLERRAPAEAGLREAGLRDIEEAFAAIAKRIRDREAGS